MLGGFERIAQVSKSSQKQILKHNYLASCKKKKGEKLHLSILSFEITGMFSCGFLLPTPQR